MAKTCLDCLTKGFDIRIGYVICFGIILFCLSACPSREPFTSKIRSRRHKVHRYLRRLFKPHVDKVKQRFGRWKRNL